MTSQPRDKTRDSTKHDSAKFGIDLYSVTRQGGSINIIQVTVYSFTVPALKLMKVKFCLFLATTAHCHDRAAIKIHITHFTRIFNDHLIL